MLSSDPPPRERSKRPCQYFRLELLVRIVDALSMTSTEPNRFAWLRTQKLVLFLTFLMAAARLFAQLPAARLLTVFPPGGKAGSTVEVTITGAELDDPVQ